VDGKDDELEVVVRTLELELLGIEELMTELELDDVVLELVAVALADLTCFKPPQTSVFVEAAPTADFI
jgi:hypothetical protein